MEKRSVGRPPTGKPKPIQVHLYLPPEVYNAIQTLIGNKGKMNTWLVEAAKQRLQRDGEQNSPI